MRINMWLLCICMFAVSSAFPAGEFYGNRRQFGPFNVELANFPRSRNTRMCLPSLFLSQICLPSAFEFFMPWHSLNVGGERCLAIPVARAHVIKVCPERREAPSTAGTPGEPTKELENEKESLPENLNSRAEAEEEKGEAEKLVRGEEAEGVAAEREETAGVDDGFQKFHSDEERNRVFRVSEEVIEVEQKPKVFDDDVSILENLV